MSYEPLCSICQNPYHPRRPNEMYCNSCYTKHHEAIINKAPWVQYCVKSETARRRWDSYSENGKLKYAQLVWGLGTVFDVMNGKVVLLGNREDGAE